MGILAQQGGDLGWVIPVVVVVIYILSYLWSAIQGPQQQNPRRDRQRRPQGERPLQPAGGQPGEPDKSQSELNSEIEEFLRRANERRAEKSQRASQRPEEQRPGQRRQRVAAQQPREPQPPRVAPPPPQHEPLHAELVEDQSAPQHVESVAESVAAHLGARLYDSREERLADDVSRSELEFSQHVQQVFEHRLGSLTAAETPSPDEPQEQIISPYAMKEARAKAAAGILVNSQSLRQAVILREILERPVDRW